MLLDAARRLRPLADALASVVLGVAAINGLFLLMDRIEPRWLSVVVAGGGFVETSHARVFAASQELDDPRTPDFNTVAILGLSGARESLSIDLLEEYDGVEARYMALCGAGGAMDSIDALAEPLFDYEVVPDLVVIGVSPHLLIEPPPPALIATENDRGPHDDRSLSKRLRQTVKDLLQLRARRADVAGIWSEATATGRRSFMRMMGEPVRADGIEPWGELWHADWPERATRATIEGMLSGYGRRGCFTPENYGSEAGRRQAAFLGDLTLRLAERGSRVLVLMVPESTELRARIPDEGVRAIVAAIPADEEERIELLDFRDALPDEEFIEVSHANRYGKKTFSEMIGPEIARRLDPPSERSTTR